MHSKERVVRNRPGASRVCAEVPLRADLGPFWGEKRPFWLTKSTKFVHDFKVDLLIINKLMSNLRVLWVSKSFLFNFCEDSGASGDVCSFELPPPPTPFLWLSNLVSMTCLSITGRNPLIPDGLDRKIFHPKELRTGNREQPVAGSWRRGGSGLLVDHGTIVRQSGEMIGKLAQKIIVMESVK